MAGFPIQLPDGSTVNIVHKDGAEGLNERFTDEAGNVYMRNASGGMSRQFVLVEAADIITDEQIEAIEAEIEPADGGEVYEEDDETEVEADIVVTLESGEDAVFASDDDDPELPEAA